MKKIFYLVVLSIGISNIYSQQITVLDKETNKPIENVTISNLSNDKFLLTNLNGQVHLDDFTEDEILIIQSLGYVKLKKTKRVLASNNYILHLNPQSFKLDDIVISASKFRQQKKDVPQKITTISAKDVQFQNPQTAADLLEASGQVFVQKSQQGGGSPMLRGFATNRILLSVDGVRMNNAIFRSGNLQNVISLNPFAIEKTEVYFGPGSTLYGSDAIGGVMSFYTLEPTFSDNEKPYVKGSFTARYASANNENTGHFDVNVGLKKWAFATSISHNRYDDLRMGKFGPDDFLRRSYVERLEGQDVEVRNRNPLVQKFSGFNQTNIMQKARFKHNDLDVTYAFHYSATSDVDRYDRLTRERNGELRSAEWYYGPKVWMMNHLKVDYTKANIAFDQMSLNVAHQHFEESRNDRNVGSDNLRQRFEMVNAYSANLDFTKKINNKLNLNYGAEMIYNDVISLGSNENIATGVVRPDATRYPMSNWFSMAAYVSANYKLTEKVNLSAALRYNHFILNSEFDTTFYPFNFTEAQINNGSPTGSLGFTYLPEKSTIISGHFSTGFRTPNVDDIGKVFDSEPRSVIVPNPNLNAEYAYSGDIGIRKIFNDVLSVELNGFYTFLSNALVRRDFQLNGVDSIFYDGTFSQVQAIQNASKANVYGLQAQVELKLKNGFYAQSILNFQRGDEEIDDGTTSRSRHAAPMFGVSRMGYRKGRLQIELNSIYSAAINSDDMPFEESRKDEIYAKDENGLNFSPAWYTLNFKAGYVINENFSVNAGLENITNQRYRTYSSGIAGAGINFIMSLTARF